MQWVYSYLIKALRCFQFIITLFFPKQRQRKMTFTARRHSVFIMDQSLTAINITRKGYFNHCWITVLKS